MYIKGQFIGDFHKVWKLYKEGKLEKILRDYKLVK